LIDLLDDALWSPPVRLKLHDLVREASKTPISAAESVESVAVTLAPAPDGGEVLISPRVGMGLVGIAVAFVAAKHPDVVPHIEVTTDGADACGVLIRKEPGDGGGMMLIRRPLIAPSLPCLDTVATLTGARVMRPADGSRVSLSWYAGGHEREQPNP
jgi:hypothetical protein